MKHEKFILGIIIIGIGMIISCRQKVMTDREVYKLYDLYDIVNGDKYANLSSIRDIELYVAYPFEVGHVITVDNYEQEERIKSRTIRIIEDEESFRKNCDFSACLKDYIAYHIQNLLLNAKEIDKDKIKSRKIKNENIVTQGGMIIDINYEDGLTESYIMNNDGKYLFYKKSEPEKFYKMPKEILDAYCSNLSFSKPRGTVFGNYILPEWICK